MSGADGAITARYRAPPALGRRIGLFGGSFNPAHEGHRAAALTALKALGLDAVWWMVSPQNPLKDPRETDDFGKRIAIAKQVARHPRLIVTGIEKPLATRSTADTLKRLAPILGQGQFVWIMGADSFASLHRWNRWREILRTLPIAVVDRPGYTMKALNSPAARALARHRLPRAQAGNLASLSAPAWVFLNLPLRAESSTAIRQARRKAGP